MITHEEAKTLVYELEEIDGYLDTHYHKLNHYITQQEKVSKLLELYKKLSNIYEKLYTMELSVLSLNSNYYELEIIKLKQQIKALEEELK